MEENKKQKKDKKNIIIIILLILLLLLGLKSCVGMGSNDAISEYENSVNKIVELDKKSQQEAVNKIVKEGEIHIQYSMNAVFNGVVSKKFSVKNIPNNHHPLIFEIFDENGDSIYKSKQIEPGYMIKNIQLTKELSKGTHDCKIKIGYAKEGNVYSMFPITIEVN